MTIVYHGTSKQNLLSIQEEGVTFPSYWGTLDEAKDYADSYGSDGVIISVDLSDYSFEANLQLQDAYEDDDNEYEYKLDVDDLDESLDRFGSVVCMETVFQFNVL